MMDEIKPVAYRQYYDRDYERDGCDGEFKLWEVPPGMSPPEGTEPLYPQQAIDTLRAEVEAHKLNIDLIKDCAAGSLNMGRGLIAEYAARAERAEAEADALRKDAERYRWLRQNEDWTLDGIVRWQEGYEPIHASHEVLDAAIDIARQEKQ